MTNESSAHIEVSRWLVRLITTTVLGGMLGISGYMVAWNADYLSWTRIIEARVSNVEQQIKPGILGRADERLSGLEGRLKRIEAQQDRE